MQRTLAGLFLLLMLIPAPLMLAPTVALAQSAGTSTAAQTQQNSAKAQPDECANGTFWPGFLSSASCFVRPVVVGLGGTVITVAGWTLGTAGLLFNFLIETSIVRFGAYYDGYLRDGVESGWAVFRDLANIAIIGSFVFVAISTILGSASYGVRRFLARILIAAILINFSIFFAKLSIDFSHIIAHQFEKGINPDTASATTRSLVLSTNNQINQPAGVAGAFFGAMRMTSALDSYKLVEKVANNGSGWTGLGLALLYVLLVSTLFFAASGVLIFGAALLAIRIVMLIFLLLVSSLAFGAIAIPGLTGWWDKWLDAFVRNVLFGPLLLMFLWATLNIAKKLGEAKGSFESLIVDPASGVGLIALTNFIVILGLLYAAIKIPQSMSVTGVKYADIARKAWNSSVAGSVSTSGIYTFGLGARAINKSRAGEALAKRADGDGLGGWASRRALRTLQAAQTASFNPALAQKAATDAAKRVVDRFGLASGGAGGYTAALERLNKRAIESDIARNENEATRKKEIEKLDTKKVLEEAATNRDLNKKLSTHKADEGQQAAAIAEEVNKAVRNSSASGTQEHQRFEEVANWNKAMNEVKELRASGNQQNAARAQQIEQQIHHAIEQQVQSGRIQKAQHETYEQTLRREFTDNLQKVAGKMAETSENFGKFGNALDRAGKNIEKTTVLNAARARSKETGENLYDSRTKMLAAMRKNKQSEQRKANSESIANAINKKS